MGGVPSQLVRRSLASDPMQLALLFVGLTAALIALYTAGDVNHGDNGASVAASFVIALVVVTIVWRVKKRLWWRRLHRLPIPLDVDSYVRALDALADHAHLDLEITFTTAPPPPDALVKLAGHGGGATIDGLVAHVVSPRFRTRNRDSRPSAQFHTNYRLDRWFRRVVRGLIPMHQHHVIAKVSVTHVRD